VRIVPLAAVAIVCAVAVGIAAAYVAPTLDVPADRLLGDFRITIWEPGRHMLAGGDPIRAVDASDNGGIYPPITILLTLPVSALPYPAAVAVWALVLVSGVAGALFICGVRDWRCYALAFASPPVIAGLAYGNISMVVVVAVAGAWALRDRAWRSGALVGLMVATRLFPWPLVVWLLLTRRFRAAAVAAASSVVFSFVGWMAISFRSLEKFPAVTRSNAAEFVDDGQSLGSIVANLGGSARAIGLVLLLGAVIALGMAVHDRSDDLACFTWTIAATLFASPIVWGHYYALLLVPLAVSNPRLSRAWLLPYITAPQLTSTGQAAGRVVDALTGVLFACVTAMYIRRRKTAPAEAGQWVTTDEAKIEVLSRT
jgi:hypothetical protein